LDFQRRQYDIPMLNSPLPLDTAFPNDSNQPEVTLFLLEPINKQKMDKNVENVLSAGWGDIQDRGTSCSIGATGTGKTFLGYYLGSKGFTIIIRILEMNNTGLFSKPWELLLEVLNVFDCSVPLTFLKDVAGVAYRFI
jgi:hypothetical protein